MLDEKLSGMAALGRLMQMLAFAQREMPRLDKFDKITDMEYNHPRYLEAWRGIAEFRYLINDDGSVNLDAQPPALPAAKPDYFQAFDTLRSITTAKHSRLGEAVAVNLYKTALQVFNSDDLPVPALFRGRLRAAMTGIRDANRPAGKPETLTGSSTDPATWIFSEGDSPYIREIRISSGKDFGFPVEIDLLADAHYNWFNDADMATANPALMSTREGRIWLKDGESVPVIRKVMDYCQWADQTIALGDLMDFMSEGARQLTAEEIFARDVNVMACLGDHETTRVMQGSVPDDTPLEENRKHVASFWCNNHIAAGRMVGNRVFVEVLDNSMNAFIPEQYDRLKADIDICRAANRPMLLLMHNPISTNDDRFSDLAPIWQNDSDVKNFNVAYPGAPGSDEPTMKLYDLIVNNADVIRGIFAAHLHSEYAMEVKAGYTDPSGNYHEKPIPQHVMTGSVYDTRGHLLRIIVE